MTIDQILTVLDDTPDRLGAVTGGIAERQLSSPPADGEWSIVEVLAHLRSCSDVWGGAIETIVAEDHPTIKAVSPRTWIESTDYRDRKFRPSLEAFATQRARHLALLRSLESSGWSRAATVTGGGAPLELTVHSYADRWARHERTHCKQVERTVRSLLA